MSIKYYSKNRLKQPISCNFKSLLIKTKSNFNNVSKCDDKMQYCMEIEDQRPFEFPWSNYDNRSRPWLCSKSTTSTCLMSSLFVEWRALAEHLRTNILIHRVNWSFLSYLFLLPNEFCLFTQSNDNTRISNEYKSYCSCFDRKHIHWWSDFFSQIFYVQNVFHILH